MYSAKTHDIEVRVNPSFLDDQSNIEAREYLWSYQVEITNHSHVKLRLLERFWKITDAFGQVKEVSGSGVIGKQPDIKPNATYSYGSICPLATPSGFMQGHYMMMNDDGDRFQIEIPCFSLDLPNCERTVN